MIFLSLLAKTFALALAHVHPWLAAGLWLAGALADLRVMRKSTAGRRVGNVLLLQVAALLIGGAAACVCDAAAIRWKEGIPVFASLVRGLLGLTGLPVGSAGGHVYLTTMAGPLEFAASIDGMGLKVPVVFLGLGGVLLLWAETPGREALRRFGQIAGVLLVLAVVRMGCVILLANALFDFVSYESEELPYRPFMDEAAGIWVYLPFLLVAGVLLGRFLPTPMAYAPAGPEVPRLVRWGGFPLLLLLALAAFWEPEGTLKHGNLVISTYHSQWSRSDRFYDREWYGADSGYNYACLRRLFEKFYRVTEAPGPLTDQDLEGASQLVVYDPDRRFSKEEIERVQEFVRRGGGLLVIGDHTNVFGSASHLNELCDGFGFQFRDDVLFDLDEDFHQVIDAPAAGSEFWHGMSFFKLRGPTSIRATSLWTRNVFEVDHSKGVRAIYSVNNFYPPPHDGPQMESGTFCVGAASHHGRGRVAAWADSTVFSNFEIFYPGKYEYLLNTMHWLNHEDGVLATAGRRLALAAWCGVLGWILLRHRNPRSWLIALALGVMALGAARLINGFSERQRAEFPTPIQPSEWLAFAATPDDPGHHLRDFITEEPYDQRYEVFIQWVLRTGAFPGFQLLRWDNRNRLFEHLQSSEMTTTAQALIVRKPGDLPQLDKLEGLTSRASNPLLMMFSSTVSAQQAVEAIQRSGLVKHADALAKIATAWPAGEAIIDDGGRRVMIVANAERFSDQVMGISEKVVPDAGQRALFDAEFSLIDRLFGHAGVEQK